VAGEGETTYTQAQVDALIAEQTAGLKANRDELMKEAKKAKEALKGYEGVDPEEHRRLKTAAEEAERKKAAAEGDFKALEAQLVKKLADAEAKSGAEQARLRGSLDKYLIDAEAVRELAAHSDSPALLLPHIRGQMRVVEQDGAFVARIVDSAGNVRIGKGQGSAPMTLGELIEDMKQDKTYAPAFRGTGSSGGGASRSTAGGGGSPSVIAADDSKAFLANLEGVATGKVEVR